MKKRLLSLLLVVVMVLGLFPVSAIASGSYGSVRVIVENTKLTEAKGAAWYGTLVDTQIPINAGSTMMSCVVAALEEVDAQCSGAENGYIGAINGLGEFAGGYAGAGWMGTLNDWFVDSGFNDVTVEEDELVDGDVIRVMFTLDMGYDLGGGWENQNGYLSSLTVSEGELTPSFEKETQNYTLTVADTVTTLDVTARAENKQEQVKVQVGDNEYRRGENIYVTDEMEISITCGTRTYTINVDQAAHECSFGEWQETTAPTCTEPGEKARSCPCGEKETEIVAALGHDYQNGICSRCEEPDPDYSVPTETVIYTGSDWPFTNYHIASLALSGPKVDYVDGTHVYLNSKTAKDVEFNLTAAAGGKNSGNLGINWNDNSDNTKTYTTNLVNGEATVKIYAYKASGAGVSKSGTKTFYFHVAEPNELPVLAEGQAAEEGITKTAGETYEVDLSKVFYDADGDELTYYVSVDGATATKTDAVYSYTNSVAGTYTLVFTVSDGKGENNAVYTVTLMLENSTETKTMTVQLPANLSPKFYVTNGFDNGTDVLGAEIATQEEQTADGVTTYTVAYPINATHISVRTDAWGGMALDAAENDAVVLQQMTAKVVDFTETETPATVTVAYGSYTATAGTNGWLLATGKEYSVTAAPKDSGTYASITEKFNPVAGAAPTEVVLKLPYKSPKTITAPAGATVQLFDYNKYYDFTEIPVKAVVENTDGTKTYYFTSIANDLSWRASMDGKVTEAGYLPWKGNVTVTFDNGAGSETKNASIEDNSVLLNVNGQNHLKLAAGGSYKLKGYRAWEIIKLSYQNEILTPDFNWNILSGNDVISLTPVPSRSNGGSGEHGDWMTVTALREGTAVIEVSYDALDVSSDGSWPGLYKASDPARTGLIVVTVGGEDSSVNFGIESFASQGSVLYGKSTPKAWDAEFDTLYFTGNAGQLKFAPTAAGIVTNVAVSNDKGSSWTSLTAADGVYTANIVSGNNILRVTTDAGVAYQVVRGDKVSVTLTEQQGDSDGLYEAGETVRVTVNGLHTPIPKMSGNYNPGYQGNTDGQSAVHMTYNVNGVSQEGAGAQYTFATEANYIDVIIPADYTEKTIALTDGYIGVGVIGLTTFADGGDSHRNIPDGGCATRDSKTTFHTRSILPVIEIPVGEVSTAVESITLDQTALELVEEDTETLTVTVLPETATDKTVTWSSSDSSVAIVDNGVVTAVKAGTATITAKAGDKTATCTVTVAAKTIAVETVSLSKTTLELVEEETETLTATVLPETATDKTVIWSSSDSSVATVDNGVVTAVKAGTATITAKAGDKTATCTITVIAKKLPATLEEMYEATAETLLDYEVGTGSIGGEWLMFGLARALDKEPTEQQKQAYPDAVSVYVKNTITNDGKLHSFKSTENARIALALTALGEDPADFAGYDLLKAYTDTTWAKQQGNNGASFALLALNAADYETSNRQALIDSLLSNQNEDGGWAITTGASNMDATSMAVQALAPYYVDTEVKCAVDAALELLASKINDKGQIDTGNPSEKPSTEVNAQVIVALTELGRDPASDTQFTKNGKTLIDGLATFFVETGFAHLEDSNYNQMSTEQAFYAMVAYDRLLNGKNSLYDMSDVRTYTITTTSAANGTITVKSKAVAGETVTVTVTPNAGYRITSLSMNREALTAGSDGTYTFTMPAANVTLTAVFEKLNTVIEQNTTVSGGSATVDIPDSAVDNAVEAANGKETITIIPTNTGNAEQVKIQITGTSMEKITTDLEIKAPAATVEVPKEIVAQINAVSNEKVEIIVEEQDQDHIAGSNISADTTGAVIVEVTIKKGDTEITKFNGSKLSISIPVSGSYVVGRDYTVIVISDNGTKETISGKCTSLNNQKVVQVEIGHLSTFVVLYPAVDNLKAEIQALGTVSDASEATYNKIQSINTAYGKLTADQKSDLSAEYAAFQEQEKTFNANLEKAKNDAKAALKETYDKLAEKKDEYTEENWEKIENLYEDAQSNLEAAKHQGEIDQILKTADADMKGVATGEEITVTFRLIGDGKHDDGVTGHEEYVTWIPTTTYKLKPGATMYDVFMMAISDYGLSQTGAANNYVSSIQAPACLGGYWLGEFDNGQNSGWMYTVNGDHPGTGLKTFNLTDGDRIIWHYVDDYVQEERTSSSKYYYRWLEAKDISPEAYVKEKVGEILTVGEHGKVEPSEIKLSDIGKDITFTFKPDTGYVVQHVIIDGESKGSITTYTYKNLRYDSRIEVKFTKAGELFEDVNERDWFYDDVMYVVKEGLFNGTGDNQFSPNASMNRAMLVTVLYRLEGEHKVTGSSEFNDVAGGQWYTDAVIWATKNEIVNGYGNGKFGPTDNITREQMAAILFRYAQFKKYDTSASNALTGYSDFSSISVFSLKALKWANAEGLINGRTTTTLAPQGTATRAEVAAILHRFVENVVNK